jgi:hypothetical protein
MQSAVSQLGRSAANQLFLNLDDQQPISCFSTWMISSQSAVSQPG